MHWELPAIMMTNRKLSCLSMCTFADFGEFFVFSNCTLLFIKITSFCLGSGIVSFFYKIKWWNCNGISQCMSSIRFVQQKMLKNHVVLHSP